MNLLDNIGHLVSDSSWDELHQFAKKIGLKREWFQEKGELNHYDLTTSRMKQKAILAGAVMVHPRHIVQALNKLVENGEPIPQGEMKLAIRKKVCIT